eukprot:GHVT01033196.1.p1 GENE.GHVT01033196.1~~GHVT01033196.1.p1  ORF type:complete len:137 (-),score=9.06 GHVT01033196.1:1183-1593(-)
MLHAVCVSTRDFRAALSADSDWVGAHGSPMCLVDDSARRHKSLNRISPTSYISFHCTAALLVLQLARRLFGPPLALRGPLSVHFVQAFPIDDGVAPNDHHPDFLLVGATHFHCVIQHHVHKRIVPAHHANYATIPV